MIGLLAKLTTRAVFYPLDLAARLTLDVLFGKEEPFEFTGSTAPRNGLDPDVVVFDEVHVWEPSREFESFTILTFDSMPRDRVWCFSTSDGGLEK